MKVTRCFLGNGLCQKCYLLLAENFSVFIFLTPTINVVTNILICDNWNKAE